MLYVLTILRLFSIYFITLLRVFVGKVQKYLQVFQKLFQCSSLSYTFITHSTVVYTNHNHN